MLKRIKTCQGLLENSFIKLPCAVGRRRSTDFHSLNDYPILYEASKNGDNPTDPCETSLDIAIKQNYFQDKSPEDPGHAMRMLRMDREEIE
ncbi:hypothetical protein EVAR_71223_1 [Eumeta japonica]|uniref:Uncharacterized protein n=1 Tax=Eumeta variegata TaxID=151549 RepID=A0A4C1T2T1_EUMVA|nr:hypothetical protein EVAR_71223_1 [Eumeta japonica]